MRKVLRYRGFEIRLKRMKLPDLTWWCSYIKSPVFVGYKKNYVCSCTYHKKDEVGFDTAHFRCKDLSDFEKMIDAIEQAKEFIDIVKN